MLPGVAGPKKAHVTTQDSATYDTADLAPISTASTSEQLQEVMDVARIAANAQRDLEAAGEDPVAEAEEEKLPETPASTETPVESPADKPAETSAPESEGEQPEEEEEPEEPPEPKTEETKPKPKPGEPTYSRRDAARFKADLDAARTELQQARALAQQYQASDSSIITTIREQAGDEREFADLTRKNNLGQASDQERQRLQIMQQWRTVAGPIYRIAQLQNFEQMVGAWQAAAKFDGMDDTSRQQVLAATDPKLALELIHTAGLRAGEERSKAEAQAEQKKAQAEISRLKAEVSSLKTKVVTTKPQPATPDGASPAAGPKLPPMLNADGTLNPEFEKLASSGKLYGVEKLTG